ncbi:MAG: CpsD/CapB family tyrosine-protein kinase [Solimonas sp.]
MTAEPYKYAPGSAREREAIATLVDRLHLPPDSIMQIQDAMRHTGMGLIEVVLSLKLATPSQIAELGNKERRPDVEHAGLIEAAMRKMALRRSFDMVEPQGEAVPGDHLVYAHDAYAGRSEKMRALRTELALRFPPSNQGITVAVISAAAGDGRSQLAAELAIAFAQFGKPTLLVDADMRNPSQHVFFKCKNDVGLSQAITSDDRPFLHSVRDNPHLTLLTAGSKPANPLELLATKRLEMLINGWRQNYAYVIFDTPPVTNYADALTVSTLAYRVLLVARAHQTMLKEAKEMLRRLSITQSEILGSVINHF